jgi:hypothetical protein
MADTREVFTGLENSSGDGQANLARQDGITDSQTGNHMGTTVAKKSTDATDAKLLVNANGHLLVDDGIDGTLLEDYAVAGNGADVDVATITLTVDEIYNCISFRGACTSTTKFEVVQSDNAVETVLDSFLVGPGQFSYDGMLCNGKQQVTAGSTGVQSLILRGDKVAGNGDFHGKICAIELP